MILDSSFRIELMNGDDDARGQAVVIDIEGTIERILVRSIQELSVGIGYLEDATSAGEKIQGATESRTIVETTLEISKLAGSIDGILRRDGLRIPPGDIIGARGPLLRRASADGRSGPFRADPRRPISYLLRDGPSHRQVDSPTVRRRSRQLRQRTNETGAPENRRQSDPTGFSARNRRRGRGERVRLKPLAPEPRTDCRSHDPPQTDRIDSASQFTAR